MKWSIVVSRIKANGITFNVATAGPENGKPVILLHGFPEAWFCWKHQMVQLAQAGYRVIAPDQRGYNISDKPERVEDYRVENLVEDVISIASEMSIDKFYLAGHDWGAGVAWMLALNNPERLEKLAILNVPHPTVFRSFLKANISQRIKSLYILYFQLPYLPEFTSSVFNWSMVLNKMPDLSEEERNEYIEAWRQPGAFTSMLNWYRAAFRFPPEIPANDYISTPTMIVWGKRDRFLDYRMAELSTKHCESVRLEMLSDSSHWVMRDEPARVSELLIEHFS